MTDQYLGEIRMFGGNFAPQGWAFCNGQTLSIAENDALFVLLGTTYGGDGQTSFGLPDLRGRLPMHQGSGAGLTPRTIGAASGTETVTLTINTIPAHSHGMTATTAVGSVTGPGPTALPATPTGGTAVNTLYVVPGSSTIVQTPMASTSVTPTGGGLPHDNMMPFLCTSFIIALTGIFPSRN
jgi:microcystin-dependent protein